VAGGPCVVLGRARGRSRHQCGGTNPCRSRLGEERRGGGGAEEEGPVVAPLDKGQWLQSLRGRGGYGGEGGRGRGERGVTGDERPEEVRCEGPEKLREGWR